MDRPRAAELRLRGRRQDAPAGRRRLRRQSLPAESPHPAHAGPADHQRPEADPAAVRPLTRWAANRWSCLRESTDALKELGRTIEYRRDSNRGVRNLNARFRAHRSRACSFKKDANVTALPSAEDSTKTPIRHSVILHELCWS